MGQDRFVVPGDRHARTTGPVRAGEQYRAPDEDLERHHVPGCAPVQAWGAGHAVPEPRGHRQAFPVAGPADGGQLSGRAERQGHRDRSPGPIVDAGRGPRLRFGNYGLHMQPEAVRGARGIPCCRPVRFHTGLYVHKRQRAQRHFGGLEDVDGRRGRRGSLRPGVYRLQFADGHLSQIQMQSAGHRERRVQRRAVDRVTNRQHSVLHHRPVGQPVLDTAERVRRAHYRRRQPLCEQPGTQGGHVDRHGPGYDRQPVLGHDPEGDRLEHPQARLRSQGAIHTGHPARLDFEFCVRLQRISVDRLFGVHGLPGHIKREENPH